ncbi:MAG: hypothetical protein M1823_005108 [Watsoniomyces obsoletus]|nr:MAG: hypothetical protein M1823_005108 [Watsoniomyces obsoletus]
MPPSHPDRGEGSSIPFVGNYQQYQGSTNRYQGLPPPAAHILDPRLVVIEELRRSIFRDARILDVGCNTGAVVVQLASSFEAESVTGIDVDRNLIRRAQHHLSFQRSRAKVIRVDETADSEVEFVIDPYYFPISSVLDHGHRPPPGPDEEDPLMGWLTNVEFRVEDWAADVPSGSWQQEGSYDTILALSVVKWIHLAHLDDGLRRFFGRCACALRHKGFLVIELQPWTSYEKAVRPKKSPHLAGNLKRIEIRPDDFGSILQDLGLTEVVITYELARSIHIYQKL